ncbi:hypothetical protein, partial [Sphingobacterium multivorum]
MRFYFFLIVLFISCVLSACSDHKKAAIAKQPTDTLSYSQKIIDEHSNYFLKEDDRLDTTYFRAKYPIFQENKINTLISSIVHLEGDTSMADAAHRFINS